MMKATSPWALVGLWLLASCGGDPSGDAAPAAGASAPGATGTGQSPSAAPASEKGVVVDLSPAGDDYKGMSIEGPGHPALLSKRGDAVVQWSRPTSEPRAPQFMVTIGRGKLEVGEMKDWVNDWAKGFSTPGKVVFVTDKPDEIEYSVELKQQDGTTDMAHGYGVEVKVGTETFSCSAPNLSGPDLPVLKRVCRSLTKK